MAVPKNYYNTFISVKYFLNSYRALSDGRTAIKMLDKQLSEPSLLISEWKINWIGACTLLRTAIDLFRKDQASCLNSSIRQEIGSEWHAIKTNRSDHPIFWEFLRKERDNIIHHYEWAAYEVWMAEDKAQRAANISLLDLRKDDERSVLLMRHGKYKGRDSVELLKESAEWVENRIFAAIGRAGFSPDERRNLVTFQKQEIASAALLGARKK